MELLKKVGALADVEKAAASKNLRRGKGKMRNRRYVQRKGPLVIYGSDSGIRWGACGWGQRLHLMGRGGGPGLGRRAMQWACVAGRLRCAALPPPSAALHRATHFLATGTAFQLSTACHLAS